MSRKKVGELYGTPIVTGNENTVENHELLLELNNDNTPKALKQRITGDQFKSILGEGSSNNANPGYNVTKQMVTLFNDTIETQESQGMYQAEIENIDFDLIAGENYTVVFDGTSYNVKATASPYDRDDVLLGEMDNGGPSFETYPFVIIYADEEVAKNMMFATSTEGSHTVEIKHEEETVIPTPEFKSAVDSVTGYSINIEKNTVFPNEYNIVNPIIIENGAVEAQFTYSVIQSDLFLKPNTDYIVTINGDVYNVTSDDRREILLEDTNSGIDHIQNFFVERTCWFVLTGDPGLYDIKIEEGTTQVTTIPEFESMIQGIAGVGSSCKIIYPDAISWIDTLYSQYNEEPEAGNIYFIPFIDTGSTNGKYLYPVYINELTNADNQFSGSATIIGTPIIVNNGTLTVLDFDGVINPSSLDTSGLQIVYSHNAYRLSYAKRASH